MTTGDKMLPLVKAVESVTGRRVHLSTALRWAQRGCHGIRLKTWMVGGRRLTTERAVRAFVDATTQATGPRPLKATRSVSQRDRDVTSAELDLEGVVK